MSAAEIEARSELQQAEMGRFTPTLDDGIRWEAFGLGRVFFTDGVPTWCTNVAELETRS